MNTTQANTPEMRQVDYSQYRRFSQQFVVGNIVSENFVTALYDIGDQCRALVKSASIDEEGRCHPAQYFILAA